MPSQGQKMQVSANLPAESIDFALARDYFIGFRSDQVFFSFVRCSFCNLLYSPYYFTQQQLDALYSDMPNNLLGEEKKVISRTQSGYVKEMSKKVKKVNRYLEIGPDIGLVTMEVLKKFNPIQIALVEPNKSIYDQIQKNINKKIKVELFSASDEILEQGFDCIFGVHVFDHLLNPTAELKKIYDLASANANLIIVVHNEKSLLNKILKSKWPPYCLQHPQIYNKKTIKLLIESAGWEVISIKSTTNWFSLNHFVKLGAKVIGLNFKFLSYVPNMQVPFRLGNIICIAQKGK